MCFSSLNEIKCGKCVIIFSAQRQSTSLDDNFRYKIEPIKWAPRRNVRKRIYVWMNIARVSFYLSLKFHVTVSGADVTVLEPFTYLRSSRLAERFARVCVCEWECDVMWRVLVEWDGNSMPINLRRWLDSCAQNVTIYAYFFPKQPGWKWSEFPFGISSSSATGTRRQRHMYPLINFTWCCVCCCAASVNSHTFQFQFHREVDERTPHSTCRAKNVCLETTSLICFRDVFCDSLLHLRRVNRAFDGCPNHFQLECGIGRINVHLIMHFVPFLGFISSLNKLIFVQ